jgi:putative spermidine/putrescine transport system substrate-binding protein
MHTTKGEHTMNKIGKSRCAIAVGAVALALGAAQVNAAELTVVNFGGANGDAQKAAFNQPFESQSGNKVTAVEYNGEQAKVKALVEA